MGWKRKTGGLVGAIAGMGGGSFSLANAVTHHLFSKLPGVDGDLLNIYQIGSDLETQLLNGVVFVATTVGPTALGIGSLLYFISDPDGIETQQHHYSTGEETITEDRIASIEAHRRVMPSSYVHRSGTSRSIRRSGMHDY